MSATKKVSGEKRRKQNWMWIEQIYLKIDGLQNQIDDLKKEIEELKKCPRNQTST